MAAEGIGADDVTQCIRVGIPKAWIWPILLFVIVRVADERSQVEGKRVSSPYGCHGQANFQFITRFCFVEGGQLDFRLEYPSESCCPDLLLYDNSPAQWQHLRDTKKSCAEMSAVATGDNNFYALHPHAYSGCRYAENNATVDCRGSLRLSHAGHTWWYFAVSRCENATVQLSSFDFHMTNTPGTFTREFSADEFGILETTCAFLVLYIVLAGLCVVISRILKADGLLHMSYKHYMVSVFFALLSLGCSAAHYGRYSIDGIGYATLKDVSEVVQFISFASFLFLLIMLAKGWTITRGRMRSTSMCRLLVVIILFAVAFIVMFVWYRVSGLEEQVLYIYVTPPGYGLVAMYFLTALWFCYAIFFSVKNFEKRRTFFKVFFCIFMPWFLFTPLSIVIMAVAVPDYLQRKIVHGITWALMGYGHVMFMIMAAPSSYSKLFPFHVQTNQISAMMDPADRVQLGAYGVASNWTGNGSLSPGQDAGDGEQAKLRHKATVSRFCSLSTVTDDDDATYPSSPNGQIFLKPNSATDDGIGDYVNDGIAAASHLGPGTAVGGSAKTGMHQHSVTQNATEAVGLAAPHSVMCVDASQAIVPGQMHAFGSPGSGRRRQNPSDMMSLLLVEGMQALKSGEAVSTL